MQSRTEAEPERHTRLRELVRRYIVAAGLGVAAFSVVAPSSVHATVSGEARKNTNINTQNCTTVKQNRDGVPASGQGSFVIAFTVPYVNMPIVAVVASRNSKEETQVKVTCNSSSVVVQKQD
jgi:hypothetical protein